MGELAHLLETHFGLLFFAPDDHTGGSHANDGERGGEDGPAIAVSELAEAIKEGIGGSVNGEASEEILDILTEGIDSGVAALGLFAERAHDDVFEIGGNIGGLLAEWNR